MQISRRIIGRESLWCEKKGSYYEIRNTLLCIDIASGDLIEVKRFGEELWFEDLHKASGNCVIQLHNLTGESKVDVGKIFEDLGCNWEVSDRSDLISIDVPVGVEYSVVERVLIEGYNERRWNFREMGLGWK